LHKTQHVAIFVEQDLYDKISDNIDWYATQYVQQRLDNAKAVVFPVRVDGD
jgi:uncharacterized protein (DUF1919 family)